MSQAHQFTDLSEVERFVFAGNALLTVVSRRSGNRMTFKFRRPKEEGRPRPTWVSLAAGDAVGQFLGTVWGDHGAHEIRRSGKVSVSDAANAPRLLAWIMACLDGKVADPLGQAEFWHEGRCGRCGRTLTVPESIATGLGPECSGRL